MRIRVAALALAALVASGCGERAEPLAADLSPYPVSVRGAGDRPAVLNAAPQRIVALDPGAVELLSALGARDRIVGVPADSDVSDTDGLTAVVQPSGRIDVDEIVALDPDLLVATPALDPVDVALARRETGAALYVQPDRSLDDVARAAIELGLLVDEPVEGRRLAATIRRQAAAIAERVAGRPLVRVFVDAGFFVTVPDRSLAVDLVRRAGGESVTGERPRFDAFTPCDVLRLAPDVVLTLDGARAVASRLARADCPGPPFQAPRVVEIPEELLLRAGPHVGRALARVAAALHPDAFG